MVTLIVAVFLAFTAQAEPLLSVFTTITRPNDNGGIDVLNSPQLLVNSGQKGTVSMGDMIKFALTPELLQDGTLRVEVLLISGDNDLPVAQFTSPPVKTVLGAPTLIAIGDHVFTTVVYRSTDLPAQLGRRITLTGEAHSLEQGAAFEGTEFLCWVDGLIRWPENVDGKRISVSGTLTERSDLPEIVQSPDQPHSQGMPVAKGADLQKPFHRFILKDAKWKLE